MSPQTETSTEDKKPAEVNASAPAKDVQVKSTFHRYDSIFTQLLAPLIATRYFWLALEDINPFNFLRKPDPKLRPDFKPWEKLSLGATMRRNFAALGMGITFLSVISFYSKNTLHDIKSLYSEAVGLELGKKKEDVTYGDIFMRSKNEAIKVTCKAYTRRTLARIATAATFFIPWHKFRDFNYDKPKYDANANAGVGAIGAYLFGEGFLREPSFFDIEQGMVMNAIHHTNQRSYEIIQPKNIQTLLYLQRKHLNKSYVWPESGSEDGQNDLRVATRIADLMNQSYRNTPNTEGANLSIGKFNYLVGFGLLDKYPESLGLIELANKSADMKEVNNAAAALRKGEDPRAVFGQYGIDFTALSGSAPVAGTATEPAVETAEKKFADGIKKSEKTDIKPRSHTDFATQTSTPNLGV